MSDHCDACGSQIPKGHVMPEEVDKKKRIATLLEERKKLETQLREVAKALIALGHTG